LSYCADFHSAHSENTLAKMMKMVHPFFAFSYDPNFHSSPSPTMPIFIIVSYSAYFHEAHSHTELNVFI
jgi:hypothetical protein